MDYDDIDYDEGYSMIDIDNNWSNSNLEYGETDSDSDSDMDNYNYNYNSSTNNWSILIGDKINRQNNKNNNSFLDRINKKLESLEADERSVIVERKNDSFLDLYERLKALNSPLKNESEFEPHYRASSTKTMIDSCYINNNLKEEIDKNLQTLKAIDIRVDRKTNPIEESITRIEDKRKDLIKEKSTIESVRNIINKDKERDKIKKGMVKEILDKLERPNSEKKEVIHRKLDIKDEIEKVNKGRKNKNNLKEKVNSNSVVKVKVEKDKKYESLKEKIDERLKLIERSIAKTQNNSLTKLTKKMEILNTPLEIDRKRDIAVLNTTELSDNEKIDRQINNTICHKCKTHGHTKKQCDRHNKINK